MPIPILMPALSPTMTEGNIAKWLKKEGEKITSGDIIAEVETDKATMEVEAIDEGTLSKIIFKDGTENVEVNKLIGVIVQEDEKETDIEKFIKEFNVENNKTLENANKENTSEKDILEKEKKPENIEFNEHLKNISNDEKIQTTNDSSLEENKENTFSPNLLKLNDRILISPLAKRIAKIKNIDLNNIQGTGPNGRIVKKDLNKFLSNKENKNHSTEDKNSFEKVNLTNIRKTIGNKLQQSKQNIPHFYLKCKINIGRLETARKELNEYNFKSNTKNPKISLNDIFIKALALALEKVPEMNATWNQDSIIYYNNVDISVAVATEQGLFTPVIKSACKKRLSDISKEMKSYIEKAKSYKLKPEEYNGGSFSISNLGMYEVEEFSAIINPPQCGILAVGSINEELRKAGDKVVSEKIINVTLSVDHRIADGAIAAKLLSNLKYFLYNPLGMLV